MPEGVAASGVPEQPQQGNPPGAPQGVNDAAKPVDGESMGNRQPIRQPGSSDYVVQNEFQSSFNSNSQLLPQAKADAGILGDKDVSAFTMNDKAHLFLVALRLPGAPSYAAAATASTSSNNNGRWGRKAQENFATRRGKHRCHPNAVPPDTQQTPTVLPQSSRSSSASTSPVRNAPQMIMRPNMGPQGGQMQEQMNGHPTADEYEGQPGPPQGQQGMGGMKGRMRPLGGMGPPIGGMAMVCAIIPF
ncbi:hypothetical protein D9611_009741 [Ephemerocybe angulata]|uniref:Uncharacterized protein n=1 Tax=Ephemerocybe angulata TaxID=980116 RepID=A0A8H5FGL9_9AGAR|nr:hypothetical protein D9611_009741 [Tulosesus angulatus]